MVYREVKAEEIGKDFFRHFQRHQTVEQCWRKLDGVWTVRNISFVEDWTEEDYTKLRASLKDILAAGGVLYGAFLQDEIKGFAA